LTEIQRLIRYRLKNIPNLDKLGPGASNRYTGNAGGGDNQQPPTPTVDVTKLSDEQLKALAGIK
jgi:hypothetical protein